MEELANRAQEYKKEELGEQVKRIQEKEESLRTKKTAEATKTIGNLKTPAEVDEFDERKKEVLGKLKKEEEEIEDEWSSRRVALRLERMRGEAKMPRDKYMAIHAELADLRNLREQENKYEWSQEAWIYTIESMTHWIGK